VIKDDSERFLSFVLRGRRPDNLRIGQSHPAIADAKSVTQRFCETMLDLIQIIAGGKSPGEPDAIDSGLLHTVHLARFAVAMSLHFVPSPATGRNKCFCTLSKWAFRSTEQFAISPSSFRGQTALTRI
jgi:hypothetical protein